MKYSLLIYGNPQSSQGPATALRFAQTLVASGHSIYRLFFYHDGVYTSSDLIVAPQGEKDLSGAWAEFIQQHKLDAVVCISAGLKRGIIDQQEADRYEKSAYNIQSGYELSGLGQLVDASVNSDRLMTFAG